MNCMNSLAEACDFITHQHPLTIAVEGNIGCGKSTFLSYCQSNVDIEVVQEPINEWTNVCGENLLAKFYEDPVKYAMMFQMHVSLSMLKVYQSASNRPIRMVERSLLSARHCFTENMRANGILEPVAFNTLDQWYQIIDKDYKSRPAAIVYLLTTPQVSYERMQSRARIEESSVTLSYIEQLHHLHENWLGRVQAENVGHESDMPIFVIDADQPLNTLKEKYDDCIAMVNTMLL